MKRFVSPKALPTAHEREVLTILIEECAEVQQRATKLLRFGRDEVQPGQKLTNRDRLSDELGDLHAMVRKSLELGLIDPGRVEAAVGRKLEKLKVFMQTQPLRTTVIGKPHGQSRTPSPKSPRGRAKDRGKTTGLGGLSRVSGIGASK